MFAFVLLWAPTELDCELPMRWRCIEVTVGVAMRAGCHWQTVPMQTAGPCAFRSQYARLRFSSRQMGGKNGLADFW
jgi:hypothetical protein